MRNKIVNKALFSPLAERQSLLPPNNSVVFFALFCSALDNFSLKC